MSSNTGELPPPLVVRFGALGDLIQLIPTLDVLAARFGQPCDVVASPAAPVVFEGLETVSKIWTLNSRGTPYPVSREQRRLVHALRQRGPSPVYVLERDDKIDWLLRRAGIDDAHRLSRAEVPRGDVEHAVDFGWRLAGVTPTAYQHLGLPEAPERPPPVRLPLASGELDECRSWLGARGWGSEPLVLLQTQTRRRKRGRWPQERWQAVIEAIVGELPDVRVLLLGSPAEAAATEAIASGCGHLGPGAVESVAHDLPLRRLFALFAFGHSCISMDTGPAHAAAAAGCPLVVLTGQADPRRCRALASAERLRILTAVPETQWPASRGEWEGWHDVNEIGVESVLDAWRDLVGRRSAAGAKSLGVASVGCPTT